VVRLRASENVIFAPSIFAVLLNDGRQYLLSMLLFYASICNRVGF
jgi:hypothetical protein